MMDKIRFDVDPIITSSKYTLSISKGRLHLPEATEFFSQSQLRPFHFGIIAAAVESKGLNMQ
jgi:hypothetical protein